MIIVSFNILINGVHLSPSDKSIMIVSENKPLNRETIVMNILWIIAVAVATVLTFSAVANTIKLHSNPYTKTHFVHTYTKKNGSVILYHRAGNPHSGVSCHLNKCEHV